MSIQRCVSVICVLIALAAQASTASAMQSETSTFTYDALGRVVEVESDRSTETVDFDFAYDDADNRTSAIITETTSSAAAPPDPEAGGQTGQAGQPD